ncbi:hypothetical protein OGAPHI_006947 [Ogataea philodendri]|uniref:SGNH hydrolase-type esterase domain-containing protein n=1 Tax=Ogataea philodendri TaxID=1378263 RepID=A0A9P8SZF2_9ASCO|nr:uncharacterized protein OGAPHI_006947 [Ogataea philodendri]KAH3660361.1 hypothetical protein OGAPHI_006947 [Ogataea philodendri]
MSQFQHGKFLLFGDSITEFAFKQYIEPKTDLLQFSLGAALSNDYRRKFQIVQRGFRGYNSEQALHLLPKILQYEHDTKPEAEQVKLAWLFFGTNDSRLPGDHRQHVPLQRYSQNIATLLSQFKERGIPVITIKPSIHDEFAWDKTHPEDLKTGARRSSEIQKQYGDAIDEVCKEYNSPTLDLHAAFVKSGLTSTELLSDGVHFTGKGYEIFYDELMQIIKRDFPHLHPENIEEKFPMSDEVTIEILEALH